MLSFWPRRGTATLLSAGAFVLSISANIERRHLSKGQQAMAVALIYPEPERGRGKKDPARKETEKGSFSYTRVKEARSILHQSLELAHSVIKGTD